MNGVRIKQILLEYGSSQKELADTIGVSKQTLSAALSTDDVRSSLVEGVAAFLNIPVSQIYGEGSAAQATAEGTNNTAIAGNGNSVNSEKFLDLLREKDQQIDKLLDIIKSLSK